MYRWRLILLFRKILQHRKISLVTFLGGVVLFHIHLHGLLNHDQQGESFDLSRAQREVVLNIAPRQRLRRQRITNHCNNRPLNDIIPEGSENNGVPADVFRHVIVNDKYHILYCKVPKVASSNWKRVFMVLNENATNPWQIDSRTVHNKSHSYFRYLHEYTPSEIAVRLKNYYKFLFVRHPFERLVSAYRNKFAESDELTVFTRIYARYIIRKFTNRKYIQNTTKISFLEFIRYLLEGRDDVMNNHWRLYDELCRPCLVYYDFIGRLEEVERDSRDVLRILDISHKVSFPLNISSMYEIPTSVLAQKYFSKLPRSFKERLYEKYKQDFEMFGYAKEIF